MEENPDSAAAILDSLMVQHRLSRKERVLCYLLMVRSEYKRTGHVYSDSLIDQALEFYGDSNDSLRLAQTRYFKAKYLADSNRTLEAVGPATLARDYFVTKELPLWKARIAELFGYIHGMEYDFNNAARYHTEAAREYGLAEKPRNRLFSLVDYAQQLCFLDSVDRGLHLLDSIRNVALVNPVDSMLLAYTDKILVEELLKNENFSSAQEVYEEQLGLGRYHHNCRQDTVNRWWLMLGKGQLADAKALMDEYAIDVSHDVEKSNLYLGYRIYYGKIGLYEKSLRYADSLLILQDRTLTEKLRQSIPMIQRDGYRREADVQQNRNIGLKGNMTTIIIVFILMAAGGIWWYVMKERLHRIKLQMILESNRDLENCTITKEKENRNLEARLEKTASELEGVIRERNEYQNALESTRQEGSRQLENLLKNSWSTMDFLCGQYYDLQDVDDNAHILLKNLKCEIKRFQSSKYLEQIEDKVNQYSDEIATKFRRECPFLSAKEINVGILTFSGMSVKSICLILGMTRDYLHVTKNRIIGKLLSHQIPNATLFIDKLNVKKRAGKVDGQE